MSDNKMNGKDFVVGAVVGGLLGAMAALLLASKPGKELREDITEQYRKVGEKTRELADNVSHKTLDTANQISSATTEMAGSLKELAVNVVDEVQSWREARKDSGGVPAKETAASAEASNEDEPTKP